MKTTAPLPGQPFIQDILLETLETGFRVKVVIGNHGQPVDLMIKVKDRHGSLLKEMTVIETPDEINSYVLHVKAPPGETLRILALVQNNTLGVLHQFSKDFHL